MKKNLLLSFCLFSLSHIYGQSWGHETNYLYTSFWYDSYPANITGFRAATVERWLNNAWVNNYRLTIPQLDTKGSPLSIETSLWNSASNNFIRYSRFNCINNTNGKPLSMRNQTFVAATQTWKNSFRDSMNYTATGQLSLKTSLSVLSNGNFDPVERDSFSYLANGFLNAKFHELTAIWVPTGERIWGADQRDSFVYDASNRVIQWHQDPWIGSRFVILQRHNIGYDANSRRSFLTREGFNGSTWDTLFRYDYTYNTQGQVATMTRQQRLVGTANYANHTRFSFVYNANGTVQQELMESNISGTWTNNTRTTYSYTPLSIENLVLSEDIVSIHPNPSLKGSKLNIQLLDRSFKLKSIKVFDVAGNLIGSQTQVFGNEKGDFAEITSQNVSKGLYFVKIEMINGQFLTKKWTVL